MTPDQLRIVTWNIWFGQYNRSTRRQALWDELDALEPDVICLQEALPDDLEHQRIQRLRDRGWWCSDESLLHYDVIMLSRIGVTHRERLPLPTMMGRSLLMARLDVDPPLTVATVHLESTASMTEARLQQLREIDAHLGPETNAVFLGDMNFSDEDDQETDHMQHWLDTWRHLRPDEPGYTIDSEANEMRYLGKRKHSQRRLDRVFVRGEGWVPHQIERTGTESLPNDALTFVSDHFGLVVDLARHDGAD